MPTDEINLILFSMSFSKHDSLSMKLWIVNNGEKPDRGVNLATWSRYFEANMLHFHSKCFKYKHIWYIYPELSLWWIIHKIHKIILYCTALIQMWENISAKFKYLAFTKSEKIQRLLTAGTNVSIMVRLNPRNL